MTYYITIKQAEALEWLQAQAPVGEWFTVPHEHMTNRFHKMVSQLEERGFIVTERARMKRGRPVCVVRRLDHPCVEVVETIHKTPDGRELCAIKKLASLAGLPPPPPPRKPFKLIPYAGYDGSSDSAW